MSCGVSSSSIPFDVLGLGGLVLWGMLIVVKRVIRVQS